VVGAFAVAYHGYPRYTADLDVFVRSSEANVERLLKAIKEFGFTGLGINREDLLGTGKVIQLGVQPNRIDILSSISGVSFEDAWPDRQEGTLDGVPTHFIGRAALIRNKRSTGRGKDLGDADELSKRPRGVP
jgi:hypothetical protein